MRAQSELEIRILDMIEPVAVAMGLEVVRVRVMGGQSPILQIMAERPDGTMTVATCAKFSRALNPVLEAEDPIATEYALEVSSPGIDRPLTRVGDFGQWAGHEAKIELGTPGADGRKRFHGSIVSETDGVVELALKDGGSAQLPVADMVKAHLVFTDRLVQAARARGQAPVEVAEDDEDSDDGETEAGVDEEDFDDVEVDEDDEEFDDEALLQVELEQEDDPKGHKE